MLLQEDTLTTNTALDSLMGLVIYKDTRHFNHTTILIPSGLKELRPYLSTKSNAKSFR